MTQKFFITLLAFFALFIRFDSVAFAQEPNAKALTLGAAVDLAIQNYPAVKAAHARESSAAGGVDLARTAYLPKLDIYWQQNRATRNNIFGILLPQSTIPSLTGPVLGTTDLASAWGSAGGMLLAWEPFDFGARKANVSLARALEQRARAGTELTELEVAVAAADSFLALLSSNRTVRAGEANVERMKVFAQSVHVLVDNQLRPGADASRADAELAAARILLIQAQQRVETERANLGEALGQADSLISVLEGRLVELPPELSTAAPAFDAHPLVRAQTASFDAASARLRTVERSYFPRFNYQFALFGRGSGALLDGRIDPARGLYPDVPNWATGLSVTFSALDFFRLRASKKIEAGTQAAERAQIDQSLLTLRAQEARTRAAIQAARRIAENTPVQLHAAREAEVRSRARYEAGLATLVEVAEAQKLLAQAESDDAVARINIWRALLSAARVRGDIKPLLQAAQ